MAFEHVVLGRADRADLVQVVHQRDRAEAGCLRGRRDLDELLEQRVGSDVRVVEVRDVQVQLKRCAHGAITRYPRPCETKARAAGAGRTAGAPGQRDLPAQPEVERVQVVRGRLGQDRDAEPARRQLREHARVARLERDPRPHAGAVEQRADARPAREADQRALARAPPASGTSARRADDRGADRGDHRRVDHHVRLHAVGRARAERGAGQVQLTGPDRREQLVRRRLDQGDLHLRVRAWNPVSSSPQEHATARR